MSRILPAIVAAVMAAPAVAADPHHHHAPINFDARSVRSGSWSDPAVWDSGKIPARGDRVRVSRGTTVTYDRRSDDVIRLIQVVGTLRFARDRDTELNVALLKVQNSDECSEHGFACDFDGVNTEGEPLKARAGDLPTLEVGTLEQPIPAEHTARIRLHHLPGLDPEDAPAIVCCSARMEIHGAAMSRTWVKLGADAGPGDVALTLSEPATGWKAGDEIIVTGAERSYARRRGGNPDASTTEERKIVRIDGAVLHLDRPLEETHPGEGEFRCEVANLSRNVIVESADPDGHRGHTLYHAFSRGGISYARFAHMGKKGVLGRYPIHFHLVADTMRGSQVLGVAVVDSHNRWVTVHGTEYLIVRDCVGYRSVGHGFFMEDGTEVYNLLDRNLGVQAYRARALPKQVLSFDPNDGAAFWWANGRNTLVRNVACENDEYGYRFDIRRSRSFDCTLHVLTPDGQREPVDVRTIGIWRFEENESHTEGLYGLVVAANGNSQPDAPIRDGRMLQQIRSIDWTGPDTRHPHVIRKLTIWNAHYAFRPHSPSMLMEDVRIHGATYGIYRPAFDDHVYRNLKLSQVGPEPFNRGMDDASAQFGRITVDGFEIDNLDRGDQRHPVIHMTDNALADGAECHFRNVRFGSTKARRPVFNRGGSVRADPFVKTGVPYYLHDHFGPGRHAKIVSTAAADLYGDGSGFVREAPLTGDESALTEVSGVDWPELLDPVDDLPPATAITSLVRDGGSVLVRGITHDNGTIVSVKVNGTEAEVLATGPGVVDWQAVVPVPRDGHVTAAALDDSGNLERTAHRVRVND